MLFFRCLAAAAPRAVFSPNENESWFCSTNLSLALATMLAAAAPVLAEDDQNLAQTWFGKTKCDQNITLQTALALPR
jgi:hypothetical protein